MLKITAKSLSEFVQADQVSRLKNGNFLFRRGYFYKTGDPELYGMRIISELRGAGIACKEVACGDVDKPFRGGVPLKNQSHFWVEVKIL